MGRKLLPRQHWRFLIKVIEFLVMAVQNEATKAVPRANGNRWKTKGNSAPKSDNQDDQAKQHVGYSLIDLRRNFWLSSSKDCDWKSEAEEAEAERLTQQSADHRNRRTTEWTECGTIQNHGRLHKMMMTATSAVPSPLVVRPFRLLPASCLLCQVVETK